MSKTLIAWDLGATKCTAGIVTQAADASLACARQHTVKLTDTTSLPALIEQLEAGLGVRMRDVDAICVGGAGHYNGHTLLLEGIYPYAMTFAECAKEEKWPAFSVIHDYAPIVCATFTSYMQDARNIKRLNTCEMNPEGRRVAFGIGTGLGMKDGVMLKNGDFWLGKNEIGHIGITTPPLADKKYIERHNDLIRFLIAEHQLSLNETLTYEKILSGKGLARLYQFLHPSEKDITPEWVGQQIRAGKSPELLDLFAWYIGLFVGTVQLIFMPEGGIWITGGVTTHHMNAFDSPDFYAGIEASPAYREQRAAYPLGVLCNHEHALIGGGYYAIKRLLAA